MKAKILIVDDEEDISGLLNLYLTNEGYEVLTAGNGKEAMKILEEKDVQLILLDLMMPEMDGFQVLRKIREDSDIPVLFISARSESENKILGLDMGGDDYITKPFSPLEVVARVRAQLRRYQKSNSEHNVDQDKLLKVGQITLDTEACLLYVKGEKREITSLEYRLLKLFLKNPGQVFTKKQIYEQVWEESYFGDDNTIMVHISRLRDKLEENSSKPRYLKTIRGLGYRLERNNKDES